MGGEDEVSAALGGVGAEDNGENGCGRVPVRGVAARVGGGGQEVGEGVGLRSVVIEESEESKESKEREERG